MSELELNRETPGYILRGKVEGKRDIIEVKNTVYNTSQLCSQLQNERGKYEERKEYISGDVQR